MAAGVYIGMRYILPVIIPFLLGWILAFFSYASAVKLCKLKGMEKLHLTRQRVSAGILICVIGLLLLFVWGIFHFSAQGITVFLGNCGHWQDHMQGLVGSCCKNLEEITGITALKSSTFVYERMDDCKKMAASYLRSKEFVDGTLYSVRCLFVIISMGLVSVVSSILLVKDFEVYRDMVMRYDIFRRFWKVLRDLGKGLKQYLKAQIKIMSVIGVLCAAGLYLMRIEHFLVIGLAIGLLDALPVLGTGMVLVPWAVWVFLQNRLWQAGGLLLLFAFASIVRQILEPKWIGKDLGVQPFFVLASIYLGVVIYGGWGFLLGPVSAFLLWGMIREWKNRNL